MKGAVKNRARRAYGKVLGYMIPFVLLLAAAVYLLSLAGDKIEEMEGQIGVLLKETEHVEIQRVQIEEKLDLISELATSSFEYTNQKTISNTRQLLGFDIPGTTNSVELIYSGIIKVGYDVSEIECLADEEDLQLIFTLPEARVLDNYIILDTMQCNDRNNIFNPIGSDKIAQYFADIQAEELKAAEARGIYDEAEEQLKSIITNYFAVFSDYEVVFE